MSTTVREAQQLFDRGLTLYYAYNGTEAVHVFQQASQLDPHLAMAYWGEALAYGSDINVPVTNDRFEKARTAVQNAERLIDYASQSERAYIEAMAKRYAGSWKDQATDERAYRAAMDYVSEEYPLDDDAACLWVEAVLEEDDLSSLWIAGTSLPALPDTTLASARLDAIIARDPANIMANHLLVHMFEWSSDHTRGVQAADRLSTMVFEPAAEHLAHMPAHAYMDVGDYPAAIVASDRAIDLMDQFLASPGIDQFHAGYRKHDVDVGLNAALLQSDSRIATHFADLAEPDEKRILYEEIVMIRFRQWDRIRALHPTSASDFARVARAAAFLGADEIDDAEAEIAGFVPAVDGPFVGKYAKRLLTTELAARRGEREKAISEFQAVHAMELKQYQGEYTAPFPTEEAAGTAYFNWGDYVDAEKAFRECLRRYPNAARAMFGLAATLRALGRTAEASQFDFRIRGLWRTSDGPLVMPEL